MRRNVVFAMVMALTWAIPAAADSWNDRTILNFSDPVMVPGATLQPGKYVFKLMDSDSNRHVVQILTHDQSKVIATTQAVPMKRQDPKGDVVLKLNPTEPGTPPALRAWFYPGSVYGHEFVYPEEQAREIAQRTKTIVLSIDQPGTDLKKGVLRTYGPTGERLDWHGDAETMREWSEHRKSRASSGGATANRNAATGDSSTGNNPSEAQNSASGATAKSREERREATAPAVQASFQGTRVTVDQLEDGAQRYMGKQISVDAEVEDVLGPRLFTIDEPAWGDLEGEILVHMPSVLAALVREDDRITVSGTVKPFVRAEIEREWGWFGLVDPGIEVRLAKRPVLVADRIVGGNNDFAMVIKARSEAPSAASASGQTGSQSDQQSAATTQANQSAASAERSGTSSGAGASAANRGAQITDTATLATATDEAVGRQVHLKNVTVKKTASDRGFFIDATNRTIFVLPPRENQPQVEQGKEVTIRGVVLKMPRGMENRLNAPGQFNGDVYVLATSVEDGARSSN